MTTAAASGIRSEVIELQPSLRINGLHPVRRRFMRVQGRGVHFLRAGTGTPVVLLHAANTSAGSQLPLLEQLVSDHTVFAFDLPGFGDSDPLPKRTVHVADAADVLGAALTALSIPACVVYGSHTGGSVALELARRHPARVGALIIDGFHVFNRRELKPLLSEQYMPAFVVKDDGSHLLSAWMKSRDVATWFPWNQRSARNRHAAAAMPSPETLHEGFLDRLRSGDHYRSMYGAALRHRAPPVVAALTLPIAFMTAADDPLFPHLDRLPKLKASQQISRYPADRPAYMKALVQMVRSYRVQAAAPADVPFRPTAGVINRRYVDLAGGQILVRSAGEGRRGRPLLLLHDGRASSRVFESLMRVLSQERPVYAPDLPDNGGSDALVQQRPRISHYAEAVALAVATLKVEHCDIYAVGAGAVVALDVLSRRAFATTAAVLEAPAFYAPTFARRLASGWAPLLAPQWDGSHLNSLWLMLRDEYAFWPWFDKSSMAACALDAPGDWNELHAQATDILRSLGTYHRLTAAALRYPWTEPLRRSQSRPITLAVTADDPQRIHTEAAARLACSSSVATLSRAVNEKAEAILRLLSGRRRPRASRTGRR